MSPLISIILPVYNGERFLEEAIESILSQTFSNFELIIVNDASSDNSLKIAEEFAKKDKRLKILSNEKNLRLPGSLNRGHVLSSGKFLTWTSDDNILKPNFLQSLLTGIYSMDCDVIFSDFDIIWEDGSLKRKHKSGPLEELIFGDAIGASFLYKREVYDKLKGYNEELFLCEDYDFFLRASLEFRLGYLEENLYKYRLHNNSLSSNISRDTQYKNDHKFALKKMYCGLQEEIGMHSQTIDIIVALYFKEPLSIQKILAGKKNIKKDILKYYCCTNNSEIDKKTALLSNKLFWNWYLNQKEQTLHNLIKIFTKNKSILFNRYNNRNAVIRVMLNCLNPFFYK